MSPIYVHSSSAQCYSNTKFDKHHLVIVLMIMILSRTYEESYDPFLKPFLQKLNGSTFLLFTYLNMSKISSLCFSSTDEKSRVCMQTSKRWMWFSWNVYWPFFRVSQGPISSKWISMQECKRLLLHGEMSHPG